VADSVKATLPVGEDRLVASLGRVTAVAAYAIEGRPALATASDDRTVRRWDAATGAAIGEPLTGHRGSVQAVAACIAEGERLGDRHSDRQVGRAAADGRQPQEPANVVR
jgi:hypothetical protein